MPYLRSLVFLLLAGSFMAGARAAAPPAPVDLVLANAQIELTFRSSTSNLWLASVRDVASGHVFTQGSANLWSVSFEGRDNVKRTVQPDSIAGHGLTTQLVDGNRLVALWSKIPVGSDKYNVFVQVQLNGDQADFTIAVSSTRQNQRVALVSYPRLELDVPAEPALFVPVRQGALTRDPLAIAAREVLYPGGTLNTGSMQVYAWCDESARRVLYLQSKDLANHFKAVSIAPRNGRLALDFNATPVNSLTYGNGYSSPYAVAIGTLPGRWPDAIDRYRRWIATAPWVQGGTLEQRGVPAVTRSPFYMFAGYCEDEPFDCDPNDPATLAGMAETLIQWKEYLGIDPSVPVPALWWIYQVTTDSQGRRERFPNIVVFDGTAEAIATAAAYGGSIAPYWETVGWTYQSDSWFAHGVEPYMLRKKNGAVLVRPDGAAVPEQWFDAFRALHQDALATRILEDGLGGIYYDVVSGFAPIPDYNPALPTVGGGTYWGDGTKALFREHKTLFPGSFVMSEYPNEIYADLVDVPQNNSSQENLGWWQADPWVLVPAYAMAYHAYQRQPPSIGMSLIDDPALERVGFYWYAYNFAIGAMMAISATSQSPCYATDPALTPGGAAVFAFQREMIRHHQRFLDYFATGELLRPLEVATEYVDRSEVIAVPTCADGRCFPQYDSGAGLGVGKVFATAYGSTSSNGILIAVVNWWEEPTPASIAIDVRDLGLDETKDYDLHDVTATSSQWLATLTSPFSIDEPAFPARTVRLYKLVLAGTSP